MFKSKEEDPARRSGRRHVIGSGQSLSYAP